MVMTALVRRLWTGGRVAADFLVPVVILIGVGSSLGALVVAAVPGAVGLAGLGAAHGGRR